MRIDQQRQPQLIQTLIFSKVLEMVRVTLMKIYRFKWL